ncbi:MAG: indolepyruvate ferredoxin oxidoreductase family protein [Alphaproteobacteria bacterium]|jgi:indolepyruvate ferredoxin oxidoreductase|nr:indolepyruvate ferredoxin oxidoreductase family protein [Alphaproteobacteria bacterium]MDP6517930.1 indolepyruvate ferredoxin oxidoreductase family protein [Alphaproteobacteria bacterium]
MALAAVSLDDKYALESGRVFLSGVQALTRLPMMQRQRDLGAGLNTAGYVSGYRGSPLGGYDTNLWRARRFLSAHHIHFQPGLNEDLAATAIWGAQQVNLWPGANYDGVFSIWYGKGPGVDRCGDVFKHGNHAGSSRHGGVLLVAGDDHGCKSSTLPHQSEYAFVAGGIPVLNPSSIQDYLDLGLHGFALSRYSGCWIGFKAVSETVDSSASVSVDPARVRTLEPTDWPMPDGGLNIRYPDPPPELENRLLRFKLPAAKAYVRANGLDRIEIDSKRARLGIVASGKAYSDVRQALVMLGIDDSEAEALGLRLYKVAMSWPLEPEGLTAFARDLEQILVVEEKRALIEDQAKTILFNVAGAPRMILGKTDEAGKPLLPEIGEIDPAMVARVIVGRLTAEQDVSGLSERLARLGQPAAQIAPGELRRSAYFCSGCPHNSSTKVPEGSRAMAGIGCHGMALWVPARNTQTITHMGGEGVNWIGQAPFTTENHVFQNLGDGTYFHSGLLAIRAAIAAKVNITYKILYNGAVAMTGGQPHDGTLTPPQISWQVHNEGAAKVVVVTDEPNKYPIGTSWCPGAVVHGREELDRVQRMLRDIAGVTVLIYDQTCAAEKRRRRKRGLMAEADRRVVINDLVCEGCGDCSEQSNCVSVQPLETRWGVKRQIDQSACNRDFSCLRGFCPSFVSVRGGRLRKAESAGSAPPPEFSDLPEPRIPATDTPYGILVAGIGGTGVVTVSALLGMAAHIEGKGVTVLDQTGLSQKNGAVASHVRIADDARDLHAVRIADQGAALLLGCDILAATAQDYLGCLGPGQTQAVVNSRLVPPAAFVLDQAVDLSTERMVRRIKERTVEDAALFLDATALATALLGDSIATNIFLLGVAYQKGLVPLSEAAIFEAIDLNGVTVADNKRAFRWGRLAAHDPARVEAAAAPFVRAAPAPAPTALEDLVAERAGYLTDYQDAVYAGRYRALVTQAEQAERDRAKGRSGLAMAVARGAFKLMAYKDEYEVARLYTDGRFAAHIARLFEGPVKLGIHLAPPLLAPPDPATGRPDKREYGPWVFPLLRLLARLRRLRGTAFDLFGYTEERRAERRLIADYETTIAELAATLDQDNHALACRIAAVPDRIKGFGAVKRAKLDAAEAENRRLLMAFRAPAPEATAAE